jgi:hypothetical protein
MPPEVKHGSTWNVPLCKQSTATQEAKRTPSALLNLSLSYKMLTDFQPLEVKESLQTIREECNKKLTHSQ